MSDDTINKLAYRFGNLFCARFDPTNEQQRLLKELWEVGAEEERRVPWAKCWPSSPTGMSGNRLIFRDILAGCENFMETQLHAIRTFITNDILHWKFIGYFTKELEAYNDLCKYGKLKGWLEVPPLQ